MSTRENQPVMESARSLYQKQVDFAALALQSPDFARYLKSNGQLDFGDPSAVRQLTTSLLKQDFGLRVEIPDDRLCPPVPNRLNYILWLQDLLDSTGSTMNDVADRQGDTVGLDIGTGCCSIYPLLGCTLRPRWKFVATDIDTQNIRMSRHNVGLNDLSSRIRIVLMQPDDPLLALEKLGLQTLHFTMCNPPFYASHDEMIQSAEAKTLPPSSTCTGTESEMVTPGGEVAFVTRMIDESLHLRDRVTWYTSMLGKLSSVAELVKMLIKHDNHNYAVTEFVQGGKTKRWALAWSWGNRRPSMAAARGIPGFPKHLLPFPGEYTFTLSPETSIDTACNKLNTELSSLSWAWTWNRTLCTGTGRATENIWSRQARRKAKATTQSQEGAVAIAKEDEEGSPTQTVALGVQVQLRLISGQQPAAAAGQEVQAVVRWIQGTDSVLFESFCGMLKRKMLAK